MNRELPYKLFWGNLLTPMNITDQHLADLLPPEVYQFLQTVGTPMVYRLLDSSQNQPEWWKQLIQIPGEPKQTIDNTSIDMVFLEFFGAFVFDSNDSQVFYLDGQPYMRLGTYTFPPENQINKDASGSYMKVTTGEIYKVYWYDAPKLHYCNSSIFNLLLFLEMNAKRRLLQYSLLEQSKDEAHQNWVDLLNKNDFYSTWHEISRQQIQMLYYVDPSAFDSINHFWSQRFLDYLVDLELSPADYTNG